MTSIITLYGSIRSCDPICCRTSIQRTPHDEIKQVAHEQWVNEQLGKDVADHFKPLIDGILPLGAELPALSSFHTIVRNRLWLLITFRISTSFRATPAHTLGTRTELYKIDESIDEGKDQVDAWQDEVTN